MSKQIQLTQGKYAIVDNEDYEYLSQWKWCYHQGYAVRTINNGRKAGKQITQSIRMHRVITNAPCEMLVDHVNCDKLDNRKQNLRVCDHKGNSRNRISPNQMKPDRYKGAYFVKKTKKWVAKIKLDGKKIHLGYFFTEIEAANAYNKAAKELFGQFANLNQIPE